MSTRSFGLRASGFGLRASGFGLRASGFGLIALSAIAKCQAWEPGAWVPGPNEAMPAYFSGTSAVAKGTVRSSLTDWIVEAELLVGGEEVARYDWIPGEPATSDKSLKVVLDSSHFPNGMNAQVEIYGWTHSGFALHASGTAPIINRIVGFNLPVFLMIPGGNGTWQLQQEMAGQNYGFHIIFQGGWSHLDVAASLENAGSFYENSHGAPNMFRTDAPDPIPPPPYLYMYGSGGDPILDIGQRREAWNGTGLPPYNSGGMPPVHFGQMDSCESGGYWTDPPPGSNAFATLLHPYGDTNWPGVLAPNQAVWTWKGYTQIQCSQNQVWWVYTLMRDGYTAREARDIFVLSNNDPEFRNRRVVISPTSQGGTWVPVTSQEQVPVWGDPYARIKYVYTGSTAIPATGWYR